MKICNRYDSGASDGVQDAVGKLKERIEGKRADLEKEETDHKYAFDMLVGQLDLNTEQARLDLRGISLSGLWKNVPPAEQLAAY